MEGELTSEDISIMKLITNFLERKVIMRNVFKDISCKYTVEWGCFQIECPVA